ncbi:MAG: FkbM family methyltransferase [Deltaproteobacteria bacterium]|nr:FkbM family methyltransferase [Deltaproteobacteria bacterium]MBW2417754.1 FkbM family methyltransferase [Deltaproteobacteria bacterium]
MQRWQSLLLTSLLSGSIAACGAQEPADDTRYETYESSGVVFHVPPGDRSLTSRLLRGGGAPNQKIVELIASHQRGGSVIDVGAHLGSVSLPTSHALADRGKVFAFEPNRDNARALRASKSANSLDNFVIHEIALGAEKGTAHFSVADQSGRGRVGQTDEEGSDYEVRVDVLDSFEFPRIDFIKIDAEGHDLDIVLGGARLIERDHPVLLIEMQSNSGFRGGLSREQAIERIAAMGYVATHWGGTFGDFLFIPK